MIYIYSYTYTRINLCNSKNNNSAFWWETNNCTFSIAKTGKLCISIEGKLIASLSLDSFQRWAISQACGSSVYCWKGNLANRPSCMTSYMTMGKKHHPNWCRVWFHQLFLKSLRWDHTFHQMKEFLGELTRKHFGYGDCNDSLGWLSTCWFKPSNPVENSSYQVSILLM